MSYCLIMVDFGIAYAEKLKVPSTISKTVVSIVKSGPPERLEPRR